MEMSVVGVLIWVAALAAVALAAFVLYRWRQREHVRQVGARVKEFLIARYGQLPEHLHINCSNDPLWPVLVGFDRPGLGTRHGMQFICPGLPSTLALLSENEPGA